MENNNSDSTSEENTSQEGGIKNFLTAYGIIFLLALMCLPTLLIANFGKLWTAHLLGVGVKAFHIGEGLSLLSWNINSVAYTIHLIPLGMDLEYINAVPTSLLLQSLVAVSGALIPLLFAYVLALIFIKKGHAWCKELTNMTLVWLLNKVAFTFFIPVQLEEKGDLISLLKSRKRKNKMLDLVYTFCFLSFVLGLIPVHLFDDFVPIIKKLIGEKTFHFIVLNLLAWVILRWFIHSVQVDWAELEKDLDE